VTVSVLTRERTLRLGTAPPSRTPCDFCGRPAQLAFDTEDDLVLACCPCVERVVTAALKGGA